MWTSLALVSRDCRHLARSRQFASIQLNFSDASLGLIKAVLAEGVERTDNEGSTVLPSLGACIRRIKVLPHPHWLAHWPEIAPDDDYFALAKYAQEQQELFFGFYVPAIERWSLVPTHCHI